MKNFGNNTNNAAKTHNPVKSIIICATFAALISVCALVSIPLPWGVPINLAHLAIFSAAGIIGIRNATVSTALYVLIGAAGVPVFSGFTGGPQILMGPTGGYIIGYIFTAFITSYLIKKWNGSGNIRNSAVSDTDTDNSTVTRARRRNTAAAMIIGMVATYLPGTIWFVVSTHSNVFAALALCVVPYLFGDGVKIAASMELSHRVTPLYNKILSGTRA